MHTGFNTIDVITNGPNETERFDSVLHGVATVAPGVAIPFTLTGPVQVTAMGKAGMTTGTFNTRMDSMDMTGMIGTHSVEIMLDPGRPTFGQTTITDIGTGGVGPYKIDSFFDVFVELSLDGSPFVPQDGTTGTHVTAQAVLPEPSTWVMIVAAVLAAPAFNRLGRRYRAEV